MTGAISTNPVYACYIRLVSWGVSVRGDFEPLLSEAVYNRVQARLAVSDRAAPSFADGLIHTAVDSASGCGRLSGTAPLARPTPLLPETSRNSGVEDDRPF